MKDMRAIFTLILAMAFFGASAQVDTTEYKFGKKRIIIINAQGDTAVDEWDDFDLSDTIDQENHVEAIGSMQFGVNGYMTPNNSLSLPDELSLMELDYSKSRSFAFNTMWYVGKMKESTFYLSPGLGLDYKSYFFKNNINIGTGNDTVMFTLDTLTTYKKYKLRATYLQVPLIIGFRLGGKSQKNIRSENGEITVQVNQRDRAFNIQAGVIGGYNIGSLIKSKIDQDGTRYKNKIKDDFNLSPFRLTATARVGVGNFGFFANYGLTPLFQKGKSPELMPFTVGVQIGGF